MSRSVSLLSAISRDVLWTSTMGVSPVTLTVSCTPPTRMSASTAMTVVPLTITPSRFTVANPGSVNVTLYVPGRRFSIRYRPALSVTVERTFSINSGLAASTDAPGSTAPDESFTRPAIVACAHAVECTARRHATTKQVRTHTRICESPLGCAHAQAAQADTTRTNAYFA